MMIYPQTASERRLGRVTAGVMLLAAVAILALFGTVSIIAA